MKLVLQFKDKILLSTPVRSELEYFKLIYFLEKDFKDIATVWLENNGSIYLKRQINNPPTRIFNSLDNTWYDFEKFKLKSSIFPLRTVLFYAKYANDRYIKFIYGYGF